jgi:hypothetical protein
MKFPDRLKSLIKTTDLTVEEFASRVGFSRAQLYKYIKGTNEPALYFFEEVKREFPWVNIGWLASGEGEMEWRERRGISQIATGNGHIQVGGSNISGQIIRGNRNSAVTEKPMRSELEEVCQLLRNYGNPKLIDEIKQRLLKIKNAME